MALEVSRLRVTGLHAIRPILGAARYRIFRATIDNGIRALGRDALMYWRGETPHKTGALRRAERIQFIRDGDGLTGFRCIVAGDQAVVYRVLWRRHYPRLKAVMDRWLRRRAGPAIRQALNRALPG